jgi:hypothetical protein
MMNFSILPPHLHAVANAANLIIKARYSLPDGIVEQEIRPDIPLRPTLHWKTSTHYLACEVAERPFPVSINQQFTDLVSTGQPIRIIVAYPKEDGLSLSDYRSYTKQSKNCGIGYMWVDDNNNGDIEYRGVSLALHIPPVDLKVFKKSLKPFIKDAYEHYMYNGDPSVGLQKLGQLVENIIYNVAKQAKRKSNFTFSGFNPPDYIRPSVLIDEMIKGKILNVPILGRCRDFANDRNAVSHKAKSRTKAAEIEDKLKENFIIGTRILKDLPDKIRAKGYILRP